MRRFGRGAALLVTAALVIVGCGGDSGGTDATEGLRLHPDNPRYLMFRGDPTVLITSGEHYGAVVNADFDFIPYLDELARHGFNLTRTFSGSYVEPASPTAGIYPTLHL